MFLTHVWNFLLSKWYELFPFRSEGEGSEGNERTGGSKEFLERGLGFVGGGKLDRNELALGSLQFQRLQIRTYQLKNANH